MNFESDYNKLFAFAKGLVIKKRLRIDAADLVNDAFICFSNSKKDYSFEDIKKIIIRGAHEELNPEFLVVQDSWAYKQKITNSRCKKCGEEKPANGFYLNKRFVPLYLCKECLIKKTLNYYNNNKQLCIKSVLIWQSQNKDLVKKYKIKYQLNNQKEVTPRIKKEKVVKAVIQKIKKIKLGSEKIGRIKVLTKEEQRIKWNLYMKSRRLGKRIKAKPITELWRKANKKYVQKQKENLTDVYIKSLLKNRKELITSQMILRKREQILMQKTNIKN